jgi:hypothetical protein
MVGLPQPGAIHQLVRDADEMVSIDLGRVSKEQVGSFDLEMVAWRRAVVSGE